MLSREKSIKKPGDFYRLKKEGSLLKSDNFQIRYIPGKLGFQVTIVVSKVITPIAPKRNKLKRIFKALLKESGFNENVLMVVYPKISSLDRKYSELKIELDSILKKIKY